MSVEAFTVDGKVTIDTTPFESGLAKVTSQLSKLGTSMNEIMEMGGGNWNFNGALNGLKTLQDDIAVIKEDIATMNTEFANTQGINALKTEIASLRSEIDAIKQKVNETTTQTVQRVREVKTEISAITSGTEPLVQLWTAMNGQIAEHYDILSYQESEIGQINAQWRETQTSINRTKQLMKQVYNETEGWSTELSRVELQAKQIELYFRREQDILKQSLNYLEQEATLLESQKALEDAKLVAEENLNKAIAERVAFYNETLLEEEKEMEMAYRIMGIQEELNGLIGIEAEEVLKIADGEKLVLETIEQQVAMEEERLALMSEITAMQNAQITKVPTATGKGAKGMMGNDLDKMSYLPRRIGSMALTMWGFNEIMDIYEKSMQNMNALGQQKAYTDLMKTDNRYLKQTNQNVSDVTSGITKMNKAISESYKGGMSLQKMYQKVDMQSVGANAMDSAFKYGVQADKLDELTEVMAIYGSEFVRQGRSQEDSILAVNDALDGEYRRLKEVNIGKEELEAHGYEEGDTLSMIKALREIAQERGYDVVAQKITNLSDAITVLEIRIAQDLVGAFKVLEPILTEVANDFIYMLDTFEWAFNGVRDVWNKFTTELDKKFGVQNMQKYGGGLLKLVGWAITLGITFGVVYKVVKALRGALSSIFSIFGKGTDEIAKTTGDIAKTGGTVAKDSGGGFKENFKNQWSKLGKDLGKMARAFVVVAVGMVMAFALIEEGILLISGIGATYDALKPQFESGINFIKEFGLWFALLGGAMLVLSYALGKVPQSAMSQIGKGALNIAEGIAIAMGVVAVAIGSLLMPMLAIISLGALANWQQGNLDKGIEVIQMFGDALNHITAPVGVFLIALGVASVVLGYAPMLGVGLAIGIAISIGLVAEAIFMLNAPLLAIASLGYVAQQLGQANIQQGAEALKIVGQALKTIADAVPSLLVVDFGVLGQELTDIGSNLLTGKDGLTYLSEEIIPNLSDFVEAFNGTTINPIDTTTVANLSQVASQLPTIKTAIDKIRGAVGNGGTGGVNILGFQIGGDTSALRPKLDALYEDIKAVIDFANKFGSSADSTNATTGVTQMANAVASLQAKINAMITTITGASPKVKNASKQLGSAIKVGFSEGSSGFNTSVVSVLAKGISEVQSRYPTWKSGGEASANKLAEGFGKMSEKLKSSISEEMGYALSELDNYKDDFYNKGAMLGESLVDGFKSKGGLNQNSPAKITKSIREELGYSMEALNTGRQMMYQGGQALGQALVNGYNSGGNLRTNVDVLASKGVNNQQLQANARNVQANAKGKGQVAQSLNPTINIDMTNSTVIGVQDLDEKIRSAVEKAIIKINSPSGAIGY